MTNVTKNRTLIRADGVILPNMAFEIFFTSLTSFVTKLLHKRDNEKALKLWNDMHVNHRHI